MDILLKVFIAFVVIQNVQTQSRPVVNTTCLELAKPSNQQYRLICSHYDYHCLLDESYTKEFEVCREWKWIPGGKCAYFNIYGSGNVDERQCKSGINLTCSESKQQFESKTNTQFTACYAKRGSSTSFTTSTRVQSQSRLVVNTSCLELAKPSNQQLRLKCSNPSYYHCLLDESYTKEFEVCRGWKWIPGGKCAYFNTYGRGNIDERNCIQKTNLTCSHGIDQFSSATNTKYTACYVKKEIGTSLPATTNPTGTHSVNGISDGRNATSVSTTIDKRDQKAMYDLPAIILGFFVPFISLAVIYLIFRNLKYVPLHKKESQDSSDIVRNEDTVEQQPFLKNEVEDTPGSPPTMRHEDENIIEARRNVISDADDHADLMDKSDLSEHFEDAVSSPTSNIQKNSEVSAEKHQKGDNDELRTNEVDSDTFKLAEVDISENLKEGGSIADVQRKNVDEEKSAENASDLCIVSDKSDNEEGDKQEETDMFDDTVESLQRIAPPTDDQDREVCTELYNLLGTEGLKLIQDVMAAIITRETGKSVKILLNQEKNKLKVILPEESHRILESKTEHDTQFHVLYGLHRIFLDEEQCPKYGWGNPVSGNNLGIGDDVERLYRIQTIVQRISNPVTVSVENYIRLLDIMIKALTRLDPGAEFKENYKLLSCKLESIKYPSLTKTMLKNFTDIVKKNMPIFKK